MSPEEVTIVVLNWMRAGATIACLRSLREADLGGAQVLVVDNGSGDGSVDEIRRAFPDQEIVCLDENLGYAGGNNVGIRLALERGARGVLLLNNDTVVAPDFLELLLSGFDPEGSIAAMSSSVMRIDRPDTIDVAYTSIDFSRLDAVRIQGMNALPGHGFDRRCAVDVVIGCSVLLSAKALREVGLLDESYFAYHEDVDWCLRARRAGYVVMYEPFSRVFHARSHSTSEDDAAPVRGFSEHVDLPNAEPLSWNPIRAYLGARNLVRIVRTYADRDQKRSFLKAVAHGLPLKFLAVVKDCEGRLTLERWTYRDFLYRHFVAPHKALRGPVDSTWQAARRILAATVLVPIDLFFRLPADCWRAFRAGRFAEFGEYVRGLCDGALGRSIPFRRLGLR